MNRSKQKRKPAADGSPNLPASKRVATRPTGQARLVEADVKMEENVSYHVGEVLTEYPRKDLVRVATSKGDTSWWKCPLSGVPLRDPIFLGDGLLYEKRPILHWMKKHPNATDGPTGKHLLTRAFGEDSVVRDLIENKTAFPPRCPQLGTPFVQPVQLLPKCSDWRWCGPGHTMELEVWRHLIAATWCNHLPSFLSETNSFSKRLADSHCLVPNQLLAKEANDGCELALPVRGQPPQFDPSRLGVEVGALGDLKQHDPYECGRTLVKNIVAKGWVVVADTYFKGHAFINCLFQDCTFQCRIFHNYFVACKFERCTFVGCEAPQADRYRLFFNCTHDNSRVTHDSHHAISSSFVEVAIGRQTDHAQHLRNKKNVAPAHPNQA